MTLGLTLLVGAVDAYPVGLRRARDAAGADLVLTEKEGRIAAETAARDAKSTVERATTRIAQLEGELRARR